MHDKFKRCRPALSCCQSVTSQYHDATDHGGDENKNPSAGNVEVCEQATERSWKWKRANQPNCQSNQRELHPVAHYQSEHLLFPSAKRLADTDFLTTLPYGIRNQSIEPCNARVSRDSR
jgi:hypothetical protein